MSNVIFVDFQAKKVVYGDIVLHPMSRIYKAIVDAEVFMDHEDVAWLTMEFLGFQPTE